METKQDAVQSVLKICTEKGTGKIILADADTMASACAIFLQTAKDIRIATSSRGLWVKAIIKFLGMNNIRTAGRAAVLQKAVARCSKITHYNSNELVTESNNSFVLVTNKGLWHGLDFEIFMTDCLLDKSSHFYEELILPALAAKKIIFYESLSNL